MAAPSIIYLFPYIFTFCMHTCAPFTNLLIPSMLLALLSSSGSNMYMLMINSRKKIHIDYMEALPNYDGIDTVYTNIYNNMITQDTLSDTTGIIATGPEENFMDSYIS